MYIEYLEISGFSRYRFGKYETICAALREQRNAAGVKRYKPDSGTRPPGIAALEEKIVQKAVTETIPTPIYEAQFPGFGYGFPTGREAHGALDSLAAGMDTPD